MGSFTTPLDCRHLDGKKWMILREFEYHVGELGSKKVIKVHKGFITDYASIPRIFWMVIGHPTGKYGKAAVIHDYLYFYGKGTRKRADDIFYEGMRVLEVHYVRAKIMYFAVRLFGKGKWG